MQLFTHCEDVEAVNAQRLAELPGDSVRFAAQDTGRTEALQACQVYSCPCLLGACIMPSHAPSCQLWRALLKHTVSW